MQYMTTFSGEDFDPIHPEKGKIHIGDIAHALSLLCRGNGQLKQFYSVAQHCINCCLEAKSRQYSPKLQLMCLLHDASEAYIADIITPVKKHLTQYISIEKHLQNTIYEKFIPSKLMSEDLALVKQVDHDMHVYESKILMPKDIFVEDSKNIGKYDLTFQAFTKVKQEYIYLYERILGSMQ